MSASALSFLFSLVRPRARMASYVALLTLALWAIAAPSQAVDGARIMTPRGASIEVLVDRPAGPGPFPVVVLGSGSSYHMRLPILEQLAKQLVRRGIAVYRFNWAYFVADPKQGKQSEDRLAEIEDMQTVLAMARRDSRTRQDAVFVAGKSLGSIIAWRVLRADPALAGALLLTPVCNKPLPEANYENLASEERTTQWILGDRDPVCEARSLYHFLAGAPRVHKAALVSGDHSFELSSAPGPKLSPPTQQTLDLVTLRSVDFFVKARPPTTK